MEQKEVECIQSQSRKRKRHLAMQIDARRVIRSISTSYVHHTGCKYSSIFRHPFRQARRSHTKPNGKAPTDQLQRGGGRRPGLPQPTSESPSRKLETPRPLKRNFATTSKLSKSFVPTTYIGESLLIPSIAFNPGLLYPPLTQNLRFHSGVRTSAFIT